MSFVLSSDHADSGYVMPDNSAGPSPSFMAAIAAFTYGTHNDGEAAHVKTSNISA
jgi:hypothetical protein